MKTEKRLTMALSVLVALMMLAVPLASSSNLFVDGGQTNSNGDAPLIGADADISSTGDNTNSPTTTKGWSVDDVWLIYDQATLNKIGTYVDFAKWCEAVNCSETWQAGMTPWIAIAFTTDEQGDISIQIGDTHTISFNSMKKGNHLATGYLGTALVNNSEDAFGFEITKQISDAVVSLKLGDDVKDNSKTFSYNPVSVNVDFVLNEMNGATTLNKTDVTLPINDAKRGINWYKTDYGVRASVLSGFTSVEYLISCLAKTNVITNDGYQIDTWKDASGIVYQNSELPDKDSNVASNRILDDMTITANWSLKTGYAQLDVNVAGDITTDKKFVQAFVLNDDMKIAFSDASKTKTNALITSLPGISQMGYNVVSGPNEQIYTMKVTSSNGNEVKNGTVLSTDDSLTVTYTMNTTLYQKITVSSEMFDSDVVLFAPATDDFTYSQVFNALQKYNGTKSELFGITTSSTYATDKSYVTSDNYYRITGFDGVKGNLESNKNASNAVTLDVSLNEYKVMFMVNGKFEVVSVAYGENPLDKCTLISGMTVDHWVTYESANNKYTFTPVIFTQGYIAQLENQSKADKDKITQTFIACFYPASQTGYAVFNAKGVSDSDNSNAYFGSKDVTEIIVTGKVGDSISKADAPSSSKDHWLFFGWNTTENWGSDDAKKDTFVAYADNKVVTYNAVWDDYKYAVTFYNGSNVAGVFYCNEKTGISKIADLNGAIVGIEYDGTLYSASALKAENAADDTIVYADPNAAKAYLDAYNKIIFSDKDGYALKQWNDADGKAMITVKETTTSPYYEVSKVNIKEIKSDISLYGQFNPKDYTIIYSGNTATMTNEMKQIVKVDESVNLFSDSAFSNDGFKLKEWNTRPDGKGTTYALGASFSLNGEQYEDLKNGEFSLYAIWEKSNGNATPGDNTDGDNDNSNTDTYLLAGILVVIIILIIVVAVVLRKKN